MDPDFSVIVATHDDACCLESTLQSVRDQDFGGSIELIVVGSKSTHATAQIARDSTVLLLSGEPPALRLEPRTVRADYVAQTYEFLKAGTYFHPKTFNRISKRLSVSLDGTAWALGAGIEALIERLLTFQKDEPR